MGRSGSYLNNSITSAWSEHSLDPEDIRVSRPRPLDGEAWSSGRGERPQVWRRRSRSLKKNLFWEVWCFLVVSLD